MQTRRTAAEWEYDDESQLVRPREGRMIAGVCAGLGRRFGMSAGMVRLLFLLSLLLPGTQVIVYLILWVLMPNEDRYLASTQH
ncbi:PspC domain-containing protein [Micromonospora sp. M12]